MKSFMILLFLLGSTSALALDYTLCEGEKAFVKIKVSMVRTPYRVFTPIKDWICQLPIDTAVSRCPRAQQRACKGGGLAGPHNVPNDGESWYYYASADQSRDVRCVCGCFAVGTQILTENGDIGVGELLEIASRQPIRVLRRKNLTDAFEFELSFPMKASSFTQGKEEEKLVVLKISNDSVLKLTKNHPVLVVRPNYSEMIQARDIEIGDILLDKAGSEVDVIGVSRESTDLPVINFSSKDLSPVAHIVVANSIQVGDHKWQVDLDVQRSRRLIRQTADFSDELGI